MKHRLRTQLTAHLCYTIVFQVLYHCTCSHNARQKTVTIDSCLPCILVKTCLAFVLRMKLLDGVAGDSCATSFLQWRNIVSIVKPLNLFSLVAFVLETAALAFAHSWKLGFSTMFFLFLIFLFSYFFFSFDPCLTLFMSILKWLDVFIVSKTFWSFVWSYYIAESLNIREKALLFSNVSNNHFHMNK